MLFIHEGNTHHTKYIIFPEYSQEWRMGQNPCAVYNYITHYLIYVSRFTPNPAPLANVHKPQGKMYRMPHAYPLP